MSQMTRSTASSLPGPSCGIRHSFRVWRYPITGAKTPRAVWRTISLIETTADVVSPLQDDEEDVGGFFGYVQAVRARRRRAGRKVLALTMG